MQVRLLFIVSHARLNSRSDNIFSRPRMSRPTLLSVKGGLHQQTLILQ